MYAHLYDPNFSKYTFEYMASYINKLLTHKQRDKIHLHGVSLGGEISYKFANMYREKVKSIVLSGASGLQQEQFALGKSSLFDILNQKNKIINAIEKQFMNVDKIPPALIQEVIDFVQKKENRVWAIYFAKLSKSSQVESNTSILRSIKEKNIPVKLIR